MIGPQKSGTTYHFVRVKDCESAHARSKLSRVAYLEEAVTKQPRGFLQMTGVVNLAEIVFLCELCSPDLHQQWLAEIEELVAVVIGQSIRLVRMEVFSRDPVCSVSRLPLYTVEDRLTL